MMAITYVNFHRFVFLLLLTIANPTARFLSSNAPITCPSKMGALISRPPTSANDGNVQISGIFPAEQGAGYDNNGLCADNNGLAEATIDKDDSLPDGFEDERKPTADNTGPPDVKSGFKGKCANKKIEHYGKRGGIKKINSVLRPVPTNNNVEPHEYQSGCSTSAGSKVTKTQIINKLSILTRQYRQAQMENEIALSANQCSTKKISKSKQVVKDLRTCLMDTCQEVCSTNSHFFKAQQEITATKNELLSREKEHSTQFAVM
jgi:hypothetical protein